MHFMKKYLLGFLQNFETVSFECSNLQKGQVNWFFKGAPQNSNEQDFKIIIRKLMSKFNI
jgi:hypothetical protein